ncbi:MAG: bacillithiol biosynthesis BshC, partial [Candidatus Hydrogenedentes bacterium]|nr:bacillithiol biosynthesis BshC [Candidatus Hydrogenedentota bacterium]
MRDLASEYIQGAADVLDFYAAPPRSLLEQTPSPTAWDPALVSALRAYQETLGATASFDGTEAVIVTGQQPGLFTGPLYAIYKAATAIRLAEQLAREQGVPCLPIYWRGS